MKSLRIPNIIIAAVIITVTVFALNAQAASPAKVIPVVPVKIQNTPLAVQAAPAQPFQWEASNVEFAPDQLGVHASFTVPAGKRLVIEFVSAQIMVDLGGVPNFSVNTIVNYALVPHRLLTNPVGDAGGYSQCYTVSQNVVIYADAETTVILDVGRTLGGRGAMHVSVSGYLVDAD